MDRHFKTDKQMALFPTTLRNIDFLSLFTPVISLDM